MTGTDWVWAAIGAICVSVLLFLLFLVGGEGDENDANWGDED